MIRPDVNLQIILTIFLIAVIFGVIIPKKIWAWSEDETVLRDIWVLKPFVDNLKLDEREQQNLFKCLEEVGDKPLTGKTLSDSNCRVLNKEISVDQTRESIDSLVAYLEKMSPDTKTELKEMQEEVNDVLDEIKQKSPEDPVWIWIAAIALAIFVESHDMVETRAAGGGEDGDRGVSGGAFPVPEPGRSTRD